MYSAGTLPISCYEASNQRLPEGPDVFTFLEQGNNELTTLYTVGEVLAVKPSLIAGVSENTSESIALVVVDVTIEDDLSLCSF